jgi:hypothetical protein
VPFGTLLYPTDMISSDDGAPSRGRPDRLRFASGKWRTLQRRPGLRVRWIDPQMLCAFLTTQPHSRHLLIVSRSENECRVPHQRGDRSDRSVDPYPARASGHHRFRARRPHRFGEARFRPRCCRSPPSALRQIGRRKVGDRDKQKRVLHRGFSASSLSVDPLKPYWERRIKPSALQSSLPTP